MKAGKLMRKINAIVELNSCDGTKIFTMQEALEKFEKENGTEVAESLHQLRKDILNKDVENIKKSTRKVKSRYKSYQSLKWLAFPEKYSQMIHDETYENISQLDQWIENDVLSCIENNGDIQSLIDNFDNQLHLCFTQQ